MKLINVILKGAPLNVLSSTTYRVKWKSKVMEGVKQGGVPSPVLFGLYIDILLGDLNRHNMDVLLVTYS